MNDRERAQQAVDAPCPSVEHIGSFGPISQCVDCMENEFAAVRAEERQALIEARAMDVALLSQRIREDVLRERKRCLGLIESSREKMRISPKNQAELDELIFYIQEDVEP